MGWTRRSDHTAGFVQGRVVTRKLWHSLITLEVCARAWTVLWVALGWQQTVPDFTMRHCSLPSFSSFWWLAGRLAQSFSWVLARRLRRVWTLLDHLRCFSYWNSVHWTAHEVWRWGCINKLLLLFSIWGVLWSRRLAYILDRIWRWWQMYCFLIWILLHNWLLIW